MSYAFQNPRNGWPMVLVYDEANHAIYVQTDPERGIESSGEFEQYQEAVEDAMRLTSSVQTRLLELDGWERPQRWPDDALHVAAHHLYEHEGCTDIL